MSFATDDNQMSMADYEEAYGLANEIEEAEIVQESVPQPGEQPKTDITMALAIYQQVGVVPFEPGVVAKLAKFQGVATAPEMEEWYDILPTGELYLPQTFYRRILNDAFGQGGWAPVPIDRKPMVRIEENGKGAQLVQEWALIAHGRFVSQAEGGAEYDPKNPRQIWSDACETVKSNALMRCCKDLSLASDCWDKRYAAEWKRKHAVRVWVAKKYQERGDWKTKGDAQWRRKDADPLRNELRPVAEGEKAINVREPKFGVFEIIEDVGDKLKESIERKQAPKTAEKPAAATSAATPAQPTADPEQRPLLALAQRAGHNNFFTARAVMIVEMSKKERIDPKTKNPKTDGNGKVQYTYSAHTDHGEIITTFSTTDAKALHTAAQEKRSVDLNCKAVLKQDQQDQQSGEDHWFINLEEIAAEA